jgi:hypothetical protein
MSEAQSGLGVTVEGLGSRRGTDHPRSSIRLLNAAFLAASPIYLALFAYFAVGATIREPFSDMIDLVDAYFRAADLGLPVEYLLEPHNFHRIVWMRSLIALDVGVFRGAGLPLVAVSVICLAGAAVLLMVEMRRAGGQLGLALAVLTAMLVFSSANVGDVGVPASSAYVHTTFFALLAIGAAASASERGGWRAWAAALAGAAAASFSLAVGLVLWPILVLMAWRGGASWRTVGVVAATGGAFCVWYLSGQSPGDAASGLDPAGLLKAAEYFLAYLGLPWVRGSALLGKLLGAGLLGASLFALFRYGLAKTSRTQRLALAMILFSLGGAFLAAIGRRDITAVVDVPVRYAILVTPLHAGLVLLLTPAILRMWESRPRLVQSGLIAALALMMAQHIVIGPVVVRAAERTRQAIALYHEGGRTPEMLQYVHPDLAHAEARFEEMRRRGVFLRWIAKPTTGMEASDDDASQRQD